MTTTYVDKTKEMVVDFRRTPADHSPLFISGSTVERVSSITFLGVNNSGDLTWSLNTNSQQGLHFLRRPVYHHPSLPPSTEALWRASWPAASLCGLGIAKHRNARPCNAS